MNNPRFFLVSFLTLTLSSLLAACGDPGLECEEGMLVDGRCIASDAGPDPDSDASTDSDAGTDAAFDAGVDSCAPEERSCNEVDDDCDGIVDEGVQTTYYADMDMDGWGDPATSCAACDVSACPAGVWVANDQDCDDSAPEVHPVADPSAPETVCNEIDDDCDGTVDEGVLSTFYRDADGDGYGDPSETTEACVAPEGYVDNADDCADTDDRAHPGQTRYFTTSIRGHVGVYDFNCNGRTDYAYREGAGTVLDPYVFKSASTAASPPDTCPDDCTPPVWVDSFPPCGNSSSLWSCGFYASFGGPVPVCISTDRPGTWTRLAYCR